MNKIENCSKLLMWLTALLLFAFVAGCGSGDSIFGTPVGSTTGNPGPAGAGPGLGTFGAFGALGGSGAAGMTNQGTFTVITGAQGQPVSIGTTGASTTITGFHDTSVAYTPPPGPTGCSYTETTLNIGRVDGTINTAPPPPNAPFCPNEGTAVTFAAAQAAVADALAAYNAISPPARPGALVIPAQLGGQTLAPGIYTTASQSFLLTGASDLTLDAGGNANAVWIFQMTGSLTVGSAGLPRSVILAGGAQPKNVFWQVGSSATINGTGGGTMVGTIIASSAVSFSTAANPCCTVLNGRAAGLNALVSMTNTVINVPTP